MTGRVATAKALLTVALLTALTLFCVSDLVLAAAPPVDNGACATQLCDRQSDCGMPIAKTVGLPIAALTTEQPIAVPLSVTPTPSAVEVPPFVGRQVIPLAPRSPPLA
ncbi:MAG: hypothetical protein Q8S13_05145 [Dehalococcoidia bacterium]|nr:hypothetical protein [Dehalococcoidia bacterium]